MLCNSSSTVTCIKKLHFILPQLILLPSLETNHALFTNFTVIDIVVRMACYHRKAVQAISFVVVWKIKKTSNTTKKRTSEIKFRDKE